MATPEINPEEHMEKLQLLFYVFTLINLGCGIVPALNPIRTSHSREERYSFMVNNEKWILYCIDVTSPGPLLDSIVHGYKRLTLSRSYFIENSNGTIVNIDENIFSLRKNGKYEKYNGLITNKSHRKWVFSTFFVFSVNEKIIISIQDRAFSMTDCPVYPPNESPGYSLNPGTTNPIATYFFGEFDPKTKKFLIDEFVPNYDPLEYEMLRKAGNANFSKFMYEHRKKYTNLCN